MINKLKEEFDTEKSRYKSYEKWLESQIRHERFGKWVIFIGFLIYATITIILILTL